VETFTPILNPPETGILGVGAVRDTPVFVGDELVRRSMLPLSLTFDHRVLDGAPAAAFLAAVKRYLEEPYSLLL
jgi:pyruvate dehydrogenase E2 component (dihydrolipoamide acetyltransferase)